MKSSSPKRERKSKRFMLCFKPFSMEDGVDSVKPVRTNSGAGDSVSIGKIKKNNSSNNNLKILVSSSSSALSDKDSIVSDERGSGRKKRSKIARVLKAVLFETNLAKKIRNRKSRKNLFRSGSNSTSTTNITDSIVNEKSTPRASSSDEDPDHRRINSNISSSMTSTSLRSSTSSSSIASISRSTSDRKTSFRSSSTNSNSATETPPSSSPKQRENLTYGLCFLLVSLLVLILWGKVCAIFCTSAWFFFVPRRNIGCDSPGNVVGSPPATDSVEYKKKVIMGGLLERNRTRMQ